MFNSLRDVVAVGWDARALQRLPSDLFRVQTSSIPGAGKGLFARKRMRRHDLIGFYVGKPLTQEPKAHQGNVMVVFSCPSWMKRSLYNKLSLRGSRPLFLDGSGKWRGYTQRINHSSSAANAIPIAGGRIVATRTIMPGEEIFFDYGTDYWESTGFTAVGVKS